MLRIRFLLQLFPELQQHVSGTAFRGTLVSGLCALKIPTSLEQLSEPGRSFGYEAVVCASECGLGALKISSLFKQHSQLESSLVAAAFVGVLESGLGSLKIATGLEGDAAVKAPGTFFAASVCRLGTLVVPMPPHQRL